MTGRRAVFTFEFYRIIYYYLAMPYSMWDLSSTVRDGTCASCIGSTVLTTELPAKFSSHSDMLSFMNHSVCLQSRETMTLKSTFKFKS